MKPPRPILFIHGERDSYIPVEQSQLLYEAAPGPKSLWVVPGAKHNQCVIVRPEYYALRTVSFFDEYLARARTGPAAAETAPVAAPSATRGAEPPHVRHPKRPRPDFPAGTAWKNPGRGGLAGHLTWSRIRYARLRTEEGLRSVSRFCG